MEEKNEGKKKERKGRRKKNFYKRMQCSVSQFKMIQKPNVPF